MSLGEPQNWCASCKINFLPPWKTNSLSSVTQPLVKSLHWLSYLSQWRMRSSHPVVAYFPQGTILFVWCQRFLFRLLISTHKTTDLTIKLKVRTVLLTWLIAKHNMMLFACVPSTSLRTASIDCVKKVSFLEFQVKQGSSRREKWENCVLWMNQSLFILVSWIVQKCRRLGRKFATLVEQYLRTESTEENSEEY